jgi:CRISPR/Cas system-associated exonuclease Cas4 (RecB family)
MLWDFNSPDDPYLTKWSKARHEIYDDCERRFFYQYRGGSSFSKHPLKAEIIKLKQKKTITRVRGEIVHAAISHFIRARLEKSDNSDIYYFLEKQWQKMMEFPEAGLLEFVNSHGLTPAMIEQTKADCVRLLTNFLEIWVTLDGFEIVYIDNPSDFPGYFLCGSHGIYARPDLIIKNGKYSIIDWKTGNEPDDYSDNILEMSMSIYLASFDYNGNIRVEPEEFEGLFYYLSTKTHSPKIVRTNADFDKFIDTIDEKISQIPETFMEEHYIPDPAKWKCKACNFATICHDGKQHLDI